MATSSNPHRIATRTRAMRVSAEEAERQLFLAIWLVALLLAATAVTATVGLFA